MSRQLRVLFLSSEVEPFAKTGGLADVAGTLPGVLQRLDVEVRVMMPRYGNIGERRRDLHDIARLKSIPIPVGTQVHHASIQSSFLNTGTTRTQVYFLDNPHYFGRKGLYVHPETLKEFPDNDERFIFFSRSTLETLKLLGWQPDIIHCNDWHTGLVPAYLKSIYKDDPFFQGTRTLLTIHNIAYQGTFPHSTFKKTGLPSSMGGTKGIESHGKVNFLKAGLLFADAINTVSEKYALEIASEELGFGLDDVVRHRKKDVVGIVNGVNYTVWNPEKDPHIPHHYSSGTVELKKQNTVALRDKVGLPQANGTPVIGMVSRLAEQKGLDLIGEALDAIMGLDVQIVILGMGDSRYHDMLKKAVARYPARIAVDNSFNEPLAHLIEAGSDMFLMPSRYEPCGLNQMYSLRYGTIPIVRATGGLDDTIEDVDPKRGTGTGFKFTRYHRDELLKTVQRALEAFRNQKLWGSLMQTGMARDFSWESSGKKYVELYRRVIRQ